MTKQTVYIAKKESTDILGNTFVLVEVETDSTNLSGNLADFDYLLRKEILASVLNIPIRSVIDQTKLNMGSNHKITNINDRVIVEIINKFIEEGYIQQTDVGNLVIGKQFFETHIGDYGMSTGILHTSAITHNLTYQITGGIIKVTTSNPHGLSAGDVVAIANPDVVGFDIEDPRVIDDGEDNIVTPTTFNFSITTPPPGKTGGTDLSLRLPTGIVKSINKYRYSLPDNYELIKSLSRYDNETGSVSINNIGNSVETTYVKQSDTNFEIILPDGYYFFSVISGTLRSGVYEVDSNKIVNPKQFKRENQEGNTEPQRVEYVNVSRKISSSSSFNSISRILQVNFLDPHRIFDNEYLISNLDNTMRLKITKVSDKIVEFFVPVEVKTIPSVVEIYKDTSEQIPQMIEVYQTNRLLRFKFLKELRNSSWDPAERIVLPNQVDDTDDDPQIGAPNAPTVPENFKFFRLDSTGNPIQKYQIIDSVVEVFGSELRGKDSLRLMIDTAITARSGIYRDYYVNGNMKIRSSYSSFRNLGILNGPYEEFFENGETRVAFTAVPLHVFNKDILVVANGLRLLVELKDHNTMVGDSVLINNTLYTVDECSNPDQFYINPPYLTNRLGGFSGVNVFDQTNVYRRMSYTRTNFSVRARSAQMHHLRNGLVIHINNVTGGVQNGQYSVVSIVDPWTFEFNTPTNGNTSGVFDLFLFFTRSDFMTDNSIFRSFEYTISGTNITAVSTSPHFLRPNMTIEVVNPTGGLVPREYTLTGVSQDGLSLTFITNTPGIQNGKFDIKIPTHGYFSDGRNLRRATRYMSDIVTNSEVITTEMATAIFGRSVIHGSYIEFHKTLAFKVRCTYEMGIIQGELIQWDEEGNREYVADFDRGNLKNKQVLNYTFTY